MAKPAVALDVCSARDSCKHVVRTQSFSGMTDDDGVRDPYRIRLLRSDLRIHERAARQIRAQLRELGAATVGAVDRLDDELIALADANPRLVWTPAEMRTELDHHGDIRNPLRRLVDDGRLERVGKGLYRSTKGANTD